MRRRNVISLTPLIDVVFILLVFFMLASSFLDWRVLEMNVAKAGRGSGLTGAMLVDLRADGVRLSGRTLTTDALLSELSAVFQSDPERRVLIRPEAGVPLQNAVDLLDKIAATGGHNVSFVPGAGPAQGGGS